ncbi:LOW QUALITY PROTEIN: LrgB domain-containing protein, partial [Cephalotus follicularis]
MLTFFTCLHPLPMETPVVIPRRLPFSYATSYLNLKSKKFYGISPHKSPPSHVVCNGNCQSLPKWSYLQKTHQSLWTRFKILENGFSRLFFLSIWLPLFYVPSLVVLPLSVRDIPAASAGGWLASLCVAGFIAIAVRKMVQTEMRDADPMAKSSPYTPLEIRTWGGIFLISFVSASFYPTVLGTAARTCLPFLLASTVLGYLVGSRLPSDMKKFFLPIICCALSVDLAAVAFGYLSQSGLDPVLGYYLTKVPSDPGAGDILMGFLGSVILSFAFAMFKEEAHAAEIFTSVIISSIFSLYSTALVGRLVGLEPALTISILPRCITVALALSIVSLFEGANSSLIAAVVVVTGLIGANFVQTILDKLQLGDPIARGIATAS